MPNLRQLTFCRLLNGSACCSRQARCYRHFTCRRRLPLAARSTFLGSRDILGPSVVADNTLTIKQKSTLPVSKARQDKSLFYSLSDTYLPPANPTVCAPRRQREHRAFVRAKARFAGQKAQEHILSVEMLLHRTYCHVSLVAFSGGKCRACLALPEVPASDLPVLIRSRWNVTCQALRGTRPCRV